MDRPEPTEIDPNLAANLANDNKEGSAPGSKPAHFNQGRSDGGDRDYPGEQPDEVVPGKGDDDVPGGTPDEVAPDQGDFVRPGSPVESPPQPDRAPAETPPD
ncbi:MAG: hypothetical protein J7493_14505 [Porphyrobacter sp.]|nr:hypothetical protein [Porphyrobacter sp.]